MNEPRDPRSKLLESIIENVTEGIAVADLTGKFMVFNAEGAKIVGMGEVDAPPERWSAAYGIFRPDRKTPFPAGELPLVRALQGEASTDVEMFLRNPGLPEGRLLSVTARPLRDEHGALQGGLCVFRDITRQREDEDRFRCLAEAAFEGLVISEGYRIVECNEVFASLVGIPAQELVGLGPAELVPPEHHLLVRRIIESDGSDPYELDLLARDGTRIPVEIRGKSIVYRGKLTRVAAVRDLREKRRAEDAEEKLLRLQEQTGTRTSLEALVGNSAAMQEVYRKIRLAAQSEVTVLLTGESGTGKELAARAIHALSPRLSKPFIGVNCSAIPEALLESELFGHMKGAFTGATRDRTGLFQAAEGGTLFLDEVGDLPPALQVKVLRALQEREIRRVGDERTARIDVRLLTATHRDLAARIAEQKMREDFYYRIRVFEIALPPLRERKEDLPLLLDGFIREFAGKTGKEVNGVATDAMRRLMDHPWRGNVRELRNAVESAFVTVEGPRLRLGDLPPEFRP